MSKLYLLAASVLAQGQMPIAALPPQLPPLPPPPDQPIALDGVANQVSQAVVQAVPATESATIEFSPSASLVARTQESTNQVQRAQLEWQAAVVMGRSLAQAIGNTPKTLSPESAAANQNPDAASTDAAKTIAPVAATNPTFTPDFSRFTQLATPRPASGSQMYRQRLAALRAGTLYTRSPAGSFRSAWANAKAQPTYQQWKSLLALEARAAARGQGKNRLSVLVGDSLSLWFPSERLPAGQFWLNQGISGDTTGGVLKRLSAFTSTRPDTIYVMAGINDLRRGYSDATILGNLRQIIRQLRRTHPQSRIVVQSILPTAYDVIPNDRIRSINQQLATIAQVEGANYLNLSSFFADAQGNMRSALTTDGLHLTPQGYFVWQFVLRQVNSSIASSVLPTLKPAARQLP